MENTLKNKEKFFAQYYGQNVLRINDTTLGFVDKVWNWSHSDHYLELKCLSDISDEDAIEVAKIRFNPKHRNEWDVSVRKSKEGEHTLIRVTTEAYHGTAYIPFNANQLERSTADLEEHIMPIMDYLRSKGYALPFHDLSVEDLVNYGWVKLKI